MTFLSASVELDNDWERILILGKIFTNVIAGYVVVMLYTRRKKDNITCV